MPAPRTGSSRRRSPPGNDRSSSIRRPTLSRRSSRTPSGVCSGSRVSVRRLLSSLLPILSLAAGCATALPPPREAPSEDARRAVGLLAARWQAFTDLRALADVRLARGGDKQQFTGALLLKAPDSLRFEALSPFGQPLLLATMHDGQIVTYNVAANAAVVGPATA